MIEPDNEVEIRRHNRRTMWSEAVERLSTVEHELGLVEGIFDDIERGDLTRQTEQLSEQARTLFARVTNEQRLDVGEP